METMKLYRVELTDMGDSITFNPRVPENPMKGEDVETERICAAPTIIGCIHSGILPIFITHYDMSYLENGEHPMWIYEAEVPCENLYQPTENEVPDSFLTGEMWILSPCKFTKVDKYYLGKMQNNDPRDCTYMYYMRREGHEKPGDGEYTRNSFCFLKNSYYKKY